MSLLLGTGICFFSALLMTLGIERYSARLNLYDEPGARKLHKRPVSRLGGMAFFILPMLFSVLFGRSPSASFLLGMAIVFVGGLWDDLHKENLVVTKLGFQVAGAVVFAAGVPLFATDLGPWQQLIFRVLAALSVIFFTNSCNLMDNMNGLLGLVAFTCLPGLAIVAYAHDFAVYMMFLLACLGGFLVRNYPHGKIFMGDQGSQLLGYVMSAGFLSVVPGAIGITSFGLWIVILSALALVLFIPFLYDTLSVIVIRKREGRPITQGDLCHWSHRLVRRGFTPTSAVLVIAGVQSAATAAFILLVRVFGHSF
jgi:UDP-GlcNAc:undecaprenyl-phosphate GlcNAc-1-phosphate transferase